MAFRYQYGYNYSATKGYQYSYQYKWDPSAGPRYNTPMPTYNSSFGASSSCYNEAVHARRTAGLADDTPLWFPPDPADQPLILAQVNGATRLPDNYTADAQRILTDGLCDCCTEPGFCVLACCCPCVAVSGYMPRVYWGQEHICLTSCCLFVTYMAAGWFMGEVRDGILVKTGAATRADVVHGNTNSCLTHCCCMPCAMTQEWRAVNALEAAGYKLPPYADSETPPAGYVRSGDGKFWYLPKPQTDAKAADAHGAAAGDTKALVAGAPMPSAPPAAATGAAPPPPVGANGQPLVFQPIGTAAAAALPAVATGAAAGAGSGTEMTAIGGTTGMASPSAPAAAATASGGMVFVPISPVSAAPSLSPHSPPPYAAQPQQQPQQQQQPQPTAGTGLVFVPVAVANTATNEPAAAVSPPSAQEMSRI